MLKISHIFAVVTLLLFVSACSRATYQVLFDTDVDGEIITVQTDGKSEIIIPIGPEKLGYEFKGWTYERGNMNTPFGEDSFLSRPITSDLTVYANWQLINYSINYSLSGGAHSNPLSFTIYDTVNLNEATRGGFCFNGWYEGNRLITMIPAGRTSNINLVAQWKDRDYRISFVLDNGAPKSPIDICQGDDLSLGNDPTRVGYSFQGWYLDEALVNVFDANVDINLDLTLYAKWEVEKYLIFFNLVNGSYFNSLEFSYGDDIFLPPVNAPGGTAFSGWFLDSQYTQQFLLTTMPNRNINLYGRIGTDLFASDSGGSGGGGGASGGSSGSDATSEGSSSTGSSGSSTTGNSSTGSSGSSTTGDSSTGSSDSSPNQNDSSQEQGFTTTFQTNGGNAISPITIQSGETISFPGDPVREGYTFDGWFLDSSLTVPSTLTNIAEQNMTVYAKWIVNSYEITFDSRGGSAVNSIRQNFQSNISAPTNPTREGFTFDGWYTNQSLTGDPYEFTTMPSENIVLYAKWLANSYTINFNSNGGSAVSAITQAFGSSVSAPTDPTRTGYEFLGWFINATSQESYQFTTIPSQNISLTARWRILQYTIVFETRAGSEIDSLTLDYNSQIELPVDPTRNGFTFGGWYTNPELTIEFSVSPMPANDITLYAKWVPVS